MISLISIAFKLVGEIQHGAMPIWTYYGLPFAFYETELVDTVGTFHLFNALNLLGDVVVWFVVCLVLIAALGSVIGRSRMTRHEAEPEPHHQLLNIRAGRRGLMQLSSNGSSSTKCLSLDNSIVASLVLV